MTKVFLNFLSSMKRGFRTWILAIIISIVIWFAISLQIFPDITTRIEGIDVALTPTSFMTASDLRLDSGESFPITVRLEGKRYDLTSLTAADFLAYADLSMVDGDGVYEVPIKVELTKDVECVVVPETAVTTVKVLQYITKTLTVEPLVSELEIIDGFQIDMDNLKAYPDTITIAGESSKVNAITRVVAKADSDSLIDTSIEVGSELMFYNNGVLLQTPDITTDTTSFNVAIPIHKVKTLPIDFSIIGYQSNFDIDGLRNKMIVYPSEIAISSPDSSIDNLERLDLSQINLSDLDYYALRTTRRETIAPNLPDGYRNISQNASASLSFEDIDDYNNFFFTIPSSNFTIINQPSDIDVVLHTNEISVNVIGPASFVQTLSAEDITVVINLLGIELTDGARKLNVNCRINGTKVPAWVAGNPQVDLSIIVKD